MASQVIRNVIEFFQKVKDSEYVTVEFVKKDGSLRKMKCTLDFNKIPQDKRPKDVNIAKILNLVNVNKIVHVFDLEKMDWRSVPYDAVKWLEDDQNIKYNIQR